MKVNVRLFAMAREAAGRDVLPLELPPRATIGDLRRALARAVPGLSAAVEHMLFAIDEDYVGDQVEVPDQADIACIPPVSGG